MADTTVVVAEVGLVLQEETQVAAVGEQEQVTKAMREDLLEPQTGVVVAEAVLVVLVSKQ